jgi:hypothetical protein
MLFVSQTRRFAAVIAAGLAAVSVLATPAAQANTLPSGTLTCLNCPIQQLTPVALTPVAINPALLKPDLFLVTMYQNDANGNGIRTATPGQTVVYPMTIGNQGSHSASSVEVWWMGDTGGLNNPGWRFVSYTADSGFSCYQPIDNYTGEQVHCFGGTIGWNQQAHITITMAAPSTPGTHQIWADIDPNNTIAELDETNNAPCCLTLGI